VSKIYWLKEETMTKTFGRVLAIASALVLTGVLTLAASPVQASSVDQRIETLEQELARLKQEQTETREQALAAEKKMPLFIYRPGSGLTIAAANDAWEIQMGNRLQVYWTFWTKGGDGTSRPKQGTTSGSLQVRRNRPYMHMRLMDGFYDLRWTLDLNNGGTADNAYNAFDAEMYIHFENISPWLPYFGFGLSPSVILNPQDNNLSSTRGARSEPGGFASGMNGVGTGSMDRGMGIVWNKLPRLGPVRISFLNAWLGQDRIGSNAQVQQQSTAQITRDGRAFSAGIGVRPFDKAGGTLGKFLKGLEISFGTAIQESPRAGTGFGRWTLRTAQTRAQRINMVRTSSNGTAGTQYYYTPGLGWTWEWITLNLAGHFGTTRICNPTGENSHCMEGGLARMSGWQFIGSFWVWSPKKGLLAGNPRDGGLMIAPLFGRGNVEQHGEGSSGRLSGCGGGGGGCKSGHGIQSGIGMWYYIPGRFMNVGVVWDHWSCVHCNSDVIRVVPGAVAGGNYDWDTITLISRFQF